MGSPDFASGIYLKIDLDEQLRLLYELNFQSIQKERTIITDGAAAMATMPNSSVSTRFLGRTSEECHALFKY